MGHLILILPFIYQYLPIICSIPECALCFLFFRCFNPTFTNLTSFLAPSILYFLFPFFSCLTLLLLIHVSIATKIESCLNDTRPWSRATLHPHKMCCCVQFFHPHRAHLASTALVHRLILTGSGRVSFYL